MSEPILLEHLTWPQIERIVLAGESLCVLPVGAVEQHGRHLPCATDTLFVDAFCQEVSRRTGVPLAPTLRVSSSHAHSTKWPGTFSYPPVFFVEMVCETARWVRASGFTKLLIVNAHGGNPAPLRVAVDEIRRARQLQVGLVNWFDITPQVDAWVTRDAADWHANRAETSLMRFLRPDLIDEEAITDDADRTVGTVFSYPVDETSCEGLTGAPSEGTAAEGVEIFDAVVDALVKVIATARDETYPELNPA
jgi:creatinine amidohydrolase